MRLSSRRSTWRIVLRRLSNVLVTLLVIAYLTLFGLSMAERGRKGLPAEPLRAAGEACSSLLTYVTRHPTTYYWHKETVSSLGLVLTTFSRSAGLLLLSLGVAAALGVSLGIAMALARRRGGAPLVLLLSILGVSTPSFLFAMLLWVANIQVHRQFKITVLPAAGFGWDAHLVMPALVLAARPLAQIAQVTYVSLSEVLRQDYIRTARAKGLAWPVVRDRHALRNVLIPILNTLGTSLRLSLASLPVVEYFFDWSGVGLALLEAISLGMVPLVTDLIGSLGLLFLAINLGLEFLYPLLDPRLRDANESEPPQERRTWRETMRGLAESAAEWWQDLKSQIAGCKLQIAGRKSQIANRHLQSVVGGRRSALGARRSAVRTPQSAIPNPQSAIEHRRFVLRSALTNPALLLGTLLVLGFVVLALFGHRLTQASPYEVHGVESIEGVIAAPPFHPSSVFPWGTDHIGRDIQALVLAGASQTLTLAFFGMLARVLAGVILGVLAGWWRGGWFDRLVTGAVGVWAAFPVTLFAMILIQAIGIQQGMWVFVVALCVVGWGEVAQFIRGQVIRIKPELFIEAARAVGARSTQILLRHVLPHLLAPMFVLGALEMGGILMLLAELGFLNLFLGGGFKVAIAEVGMMVPVIAYFSDVPEWGALLANIRDWWRSYNWLAWYPGLAFFLAIVAFNLWGEGLRRFLTESRISLARLVNRYTMSAAAILLLILGWTLRSTAPLGVYRPQAQQFDAGRALEDIRVLASPDLEGRMTGTPGAQRAAEFIANQMRAAGLFPGGDDGTYLQALPIPRGYLAETPRLEILDQQGHVAQALAYRQDFVEYAGSPTYSSAVGSGGAIATLLSSSRPYGENAGAVVGLALGPHPDGPAARLVAGYMSAGPQDPYGLRNFDLYDRIVVVREAQAAWLNVVATGGALIVTDDPLTFERRYLYRGVVWQAPSMQPVMVITPQVADRLLATAGSSLAELERMGAGLPPGQVAMTDPGATVHLQAAVADHVDGRYLNVIGVLPGTGSFTGARLGAGMDNQVVVVSAYYDGLGVGPDGTLYPGANDNASGVAAMLEMARLLKQSPYQPRRTVVFIAWAGGERGESLSLENVMGARPGFNLFTPEAVIELSGVGAGSGTAIALGDGSSYRLVRLYQNAAGRVGASTTTRGRGPHDLLYAPPGFGGRSALSLYVSWDGSDRAAHTPADDVEAIDPEKLERVGQSTLLTLLVLSREVNY